MTQTGHSCVGIAGHPCLHQRVYVCVRSIRRTESGTRDSPQQWWLALVLVCKTTCTLEYPGDNFPTRPLPFAAHLVFAMSLLFLFRSLFKYVFCVNKVVPPSRQGQKLKFLLFVEANIPASGVWFRLRFILLSCATVYVGKWSCVYIMPCRISALRLGQKTR